MTTGRWTAVKAPVCPHFPPNHCRFGQPPAGTDNTPCPGLPQQPRCSACQPLHMLPRQGSSAIVQSPLLDLYTPSYSHSCVNNFLTP